MFNWLQVKGRKTFALILLSFKFKMRKKCNSRQKCDYNKKWTKKPIIRWKAKKKIINYIKSNKKRLQKAKRNEILFKYFHGNFQFLSHQKFANLNQEFLITGSPSTSSNTSADSGSSSKGKDSTDGNEQKAESSKLDGADTLINFENEELSSSSFSSSYSGDLLHFQNASEDLI